jgi:hypothetical protein
MPKVIYEVWGPNAPLYVTSNLRRAWEAMRFFRQQSRFNEYDVIVPERAELDWDGLRSDESDQLDEWNTWGEDGRIATVHLCLAPEDDEMAKRAEEAAQQARAA